MKIEMETNCNNNNMKESFLLGSVLTLSIILLLLLILRNSHYRIKNLPNGPRGLPIIGNMLDLVGAIPHQIMYNLKPKYGPLLWLRLGFANMLVVQSAAAAEEMFKNHDSSFCDRRENHVFTTHNYNKASIVLGRYGPYLRFLKKLCSMELLSTKRVNDMAIVRRKCLDNMIRYIEEDVKAARVRGDSGHVNLGHYLFTMTFNVISNMSLSRDLIDPHSKEGHDFYEAMNNIMQLGGTPNFADFFPFLRWLDPQGLKRNIDKSMGQAIKIVEGFLEERIRERKLIKNMEEVIHKDFLDVLLGYEGDGKDHEQNKIPHEHVILIILEMFLAGSETTSTTIEWTMTELLRNPDKLKKLRQELDEKIGQNRTVQESDIDEQHYLQAVVKESLRLHPAAPLLVPRNTLQDTNFMGHFIPKDTQVLVNVWAIGRDPDSWEDPLVFNPERFLGSNVDFRGRNYEFLPFGSGRRYCMGLNLGQKVLHLAVASLIHGFDWELGKDCDPQRVDYLSESMGLTVRKLVPLNVLPKKRFTAYGKI